MFRYKIRLITKIKVFWNIHQIPFNNQNSTQILSFYHWAKQWIFPNLLDKDREQSYS